jgi:hypothetical protein
MYMRGFLHCVGREFLEAVSAAAVAAATAAATEAASATTAAAVAAATAAAVAAATAAATTAAATTTTATAAATLFARTRFVDGQGAAFVLLAVEGRDCGLSLGIRGHFYETESFAPARVPVVDNLSGGHLAVSAEQLFQLRAVDCVAQVPDIQLLTHSILLEFGGVSPPER